MQSGSDDEAEDVHGVSGANAALSAARVSTNTPQDEHAPLLGKEGSDKEERLRDLSCDEVRPSPQQRPLEHVLVLTVPLFSLSLGA